MGEIIRISDVLEKVKAIEDRLTQLENDFQELCLTIINNKKEGK